MPKYVVISNHPPNACPSANKELRERNEKLDDSLRPLGQKYQVRPEVMLHLDPGHKVLWLLEAPNAEAVRDMIYEAGLMQWNDFEFYMTTTLPDITARAGKLKPVWT